MTELEAHEAEARAGRIFEARLAEHVSARDEMISAISNQHLVLTFGTASIVGVLVAGFLTWKQEADPWIFLSVAPLSAWVLAMWLGEVVRMLRSVEFCRNQAMLINRSVGAYDRSNPPIRWEQWRDQDPARTITWSYVSVVLVLCGAYLTGIALCVKTADWATKWKWITGGVSAIALVVVLWAVARVYTRWSSDAAKAGATTAMAKLARRLARYT